MNQDAENLWKRVGLEQLRHSLLKVEELTHSFEESLKGLPKCDQCAKVALIEKIQSSAGDLGGEVVGLSALAGTLKESIGSAERAKEALEQDCPDNCQCSGEPCTCHGG